MNSYDTVSTQLAAKRLRPQTVLAALLMVTAPVGVVARDRYGRRGAGDVRRYRFRRRSNVAQQYRTDDHAGAGLAASAP